MNVDKFGRQSSNVSKSGLRGPVMEPEKEGDVVNLKRLTLSVNKCL